MNEAYLTHLEARIAEINQYNNNEEKTILQFLRQKFLNHEINKDSV